MRTALESTAAHGSVSYGEIASERLRAILLGEEPAQDEFARVHQALTETPSFRLATLAREIGVSFAALEARFQELTGKPLLQEQQWTSGGH